KGEACCSKHDGPNKVESIGSTGLHGGCERARFQKSTDAGRDTERNLEQLFHEAPRVTALRREWRASRPDFASFRSVLATALASSATAVLRAVSVSSRFAASSSPCAASARRLSKASLRAWEALLRARWA